MPTKVIDEFKFRDSRVVLKQLSSCLYVYCKHQGVEIREIKHTLSEAREAFRKHITKIRKSYERERRRKQA